MNLRRRLASTLLIALALAVTAPASGQIIEDIADINSYGAYEHGNGDKAVVGRFNTLHTVWEDGALIKYSTSADGVGWSTPELVAPGLPAAMPAIASDTNGTLTVVFVGNPNSSGMGSLFYAYKPWGASSWTVCKIVDNGTQPDVEARAGTVHVTWTTLSRVQYTSFSTASPPTSPIAFGEEIEVATCPGTGFVRPSVALVKKSCKLTPRVAYLRYSDETGNSNPACASLVTEVGPRVCDRSTSGTWSLEFSELATATNPAQSVEAISLSMNAQYITGNTFVAWSDSSNGTDRTRLAHGRNTSWSSISHSSFPMHVHVAAQKSSHNGQFRLAWVDRDGGFGPFVNINGQFRTGRWHSGSTPSWLAPSTSISGGLLVGRPNATFWGKCESNTYDSVEAVAEMEGVCSSQRLVNHFTGNQSCPSGGVIGINPCGEVATTHISYTERRKLVDTGGLGDPIEVGEDFAMYSIVNGDQEGTIVLSWSEGRMVETWEGGFALDNPQAELAIEAWGVEAVIEELEPNFLYDQIEPGEVCEDR